MAQITTEQYLEDIQDDLSQLLIKKKEALPPGFNQQRFVLNCMTAIRDMLKDSKKREALNKVNPQTIPLCLIKGAYLGLDFMNGECYAIPYGNAMNFQTDYKGEIKVCKALSKDPIKDIYAKVVREGDFYEEAVVNGVQTVNFKPVPFSGKPVIGAFAIVLYKDGTMKYDSMSKEEIERTRDVYSKAKESQAWRESAGEMYKKTVIRRLSKLIDKNTDNIEQIKAYEEGSGFEFDDTGSGQKRRGISQEPDEEAIDVFAKDVPVIEENGQSAAMPKSQGRKPEYAPASVTRKKPQQDRQYESDFVPGYNQEYEQTYGQKASPEYDPDFVIPDDDADLPFR